MTKEQEKLIIENHSLIYAYMWKHNMYLDDVEDWYGLCAIGLCTAALHFDESRGLQFSTLAYICMRNSCTNSRRKAYGESLQDVTHINDMSVFNEICPDLSFDPYMDKEFKIFVEDLLLGYKENTQKTIRLRLYNGYTYEQISQIMGISRQAVQQKWVAFLKKCKKALNIQ